MSRLTERTRYGIVGNNDRVINYPLYKVADADPLDRRIVGQCFEKLADYEDAEEQGLLVKIECHCKDCKHVDFAGCKNGTCYCYMNECYMNEDDFCKYAERYKEEAEQKLEKMKGE